MIMRCRRRGEEGYKEVEQDKGKKAERTNGKYIMIN
jgi:hypothetical protein